MWSAVVREVASNLVAAIGLAVPAVAVVVALFGHLYNNWTARKNLEKSVRFARLQLELSFYERIRVQQIVSKGLYKKLINGKAQPWRLLDHVGEVRANAGDQKLAEAIVGVNEKIVALVAEKGELVRRDVEFADAFEKFLLHFQIVSSAVRDSPYISVESADYYPREFDTHVIRAIEKINRELETLFPREKTLGEKNTVPPRPAPSEVSGSLNPPSKLDAVPHREPPKHGPPAAADPDPAQKRDGSNG